MTTQITHRFYDAIPFGDRFQARIFYPSEGHELDWLVRIYSYPDEDDCLLDQFSFWPMRDPIFGFDVCDSQELDELLEKHCGELEKNIIDEFEPCEYVKDDLIRNQRADEEKVKVAYRTFAKALTDKKGDIAADCLGPNLISFYEQAKEKALGLNKTKLHGLEWGTKACVLFIRQLFSREMLEATPPHVIYSRFVDVGFFFDSAPPLEDCILFVNGKHAGVFLGFGEKDILGKFIKVQNEWLYDIEEGDIESIDKEFSKEAEKLGLLPENLFLNRWGAIFKEKFNERLLESKW